MTPTHTVFQDMFERNLVTPLRVVEVMQKWDRVPEFTVYDQTHNHNSNNVLRAVCVLPPRISPLQLSSTQNLAGVYLDGELAEETSTSSVNSLSPCKSHSSGMQTPLH